MGLCDKKITQGVAFNCDISGGVESTLYLFNRDEIAAVLRNVVNPQIVEAFTMAVKTAPSTLYTGFKYEGFNTSLKPKTEGVKKTYSYRFNHVVDFVIFDRSSDAKLQIENMSRANLVAVVENKNKTAGDSTFEVYGLDVGLTLNTFSDDPTNADNEGAYVLQLASPDDYKEPHMPATFFDTDYTTTKTALLDIVAA